MNYFFTFGLGALALAFGAIGALLVIRILKPKRIPS